MIRFTSCQAANADTGFANLVAEIGKKMGVKTETIQLTSWEKREQLFLAGAIDVAWVCGWQYVLWHEQGKRFVPLAAPVALGERYGNRPIYYSDLIVRADTDIYSFADLHQPIWAINEFMSWSGFRVAQYYLETQGESWSSVSEIYKTGAHENSINAILSGRADVATIDSTVLEKELTLNPALAHQIRIIDTTEPTPRPPYIIQPSLPQPIIDDLLGTMTELHTTEGGREILANAGAQSIAPIADIDFDPMRDMASASPLTTRIH